MVGAFGGVVFETSDQRVLTLSGLAHSAKSRFANHEIIGQKPRTEFLGAGLDTLDFTVSLSRAYGVDCEDELEKWYALAQTGEVSSLVIGHAMIGGLWVVTSVSDKWNVVSKDGCIYSASVDIALAEYGDLVRLGSGSASPRPGAVLAYPPLPFEESFTAVVTAVRAWTRSGAGACFDCLEALDRGYLVNVVGSLPGWYLLEDGSYINALFVSRGE